MNQLVLKEVIPNFDKGKYFCDQSTLLCTGVCQGPGVDGVGLETLLAGNIKVDLELTLYTH